METMGNSGILGRYFEPKKSHKISRNLTGVFFASPFEAVHY